MIILVIFLLMMILIILMKNSFSSKERLKTCLLCKLLPFLDYTYSLDYKEVLLTTLSTSYADYQRFLLCKLLLFVGPTRNTSRHILYCLLKKFSSEGGNAQP